MITICLVCLNGLDNPPESRNREKRICTIECGHIFHVVCVNEWWRSAMAETLPGDEHQYRCPLCRRLCPGPYVFQVFPSAQENREETLEARIEDLSEQNRELRDSLDRTRQELMSIKGTSTPIQRKERTNKQKDVEQEKGPAA